MTIARVSVVEVRDGRAPAVHFRERREQLVLNATTAAALRNALGRDTTTWPGSRVRLFTVPTDYGPGIRVEVVKTEATSVLEPTTVLAAKERREVRF